MDLATPDVIYLDNNATTPLAPEAFTAMEPFLKGAFGNPSSLHQLGGQAREAVDRAREQVAALIAGASPSEIVFTSGGSESNNAAILAALAAKLNHKHNHIVTSAVEHPAVLRLCEHLEKSRGVQVTRVGVNRDGTLDPQRVADAITDETAVVSIMAANNETGVRLPAEQIAETCIERQVLFHTDAIQVTGKAPVDVSKLQANFMSLSAHKFHGPKGVGALYVRRGTRFTPLVWGGSQERRRRAGTENVAGIVGMGVAADVARQQLPRDEPIVAALRDRLEAGILRNCKLAAVNGAGASRVANTTNISFENLFSEAILISLDRAGICASSGSACSTGNPEPSHVMKAMRVPLARARGSIRFSLSRYNTEEEIDRVIETVPRIIDKLAALTA